MARQLPDRISFELNERGLFVGYEYGLTPTEKTAFQGIPRDGVRIDQTEYKLERDQTVVQTIADGVQTFTREVVYTKVK